MDDPEQALRGFSTIAYSGITARDLSHDRLNAG
jgi:hypothetical protein